MVYCGIPSKGCESCRGRRIKCDMLVDACSQCIRARRKCPGYRDPVELLFRDESSKTIEKFRARALSKNTSKGISKSPRNMGVQATPDGPALMTAESSDDTDMLLDEEKHHVQGLMQTSSDPKQSPLEESFDSTVEFDILGMHLMPISAGKREILRYFAKEFTATPRTSHTNDSHSTFWIPLSLTDDALLSAILTVSTKHMSFNVGSRRVPPLLQNAWGAIASDCSCASLANPLQASRLINEALRQPWRATNDAIIAAITVLANWQSFVGDLLLAEKHLGGLERLVKMRGGLQALPLPLAQRVQRVDTNVAAKGSSRPRFPLLTSQKSDIRKLVDSFAQTQLWNHSILSMETGFGGPDLCDVLCRDINNVFGEMQALASLFNLWIQGQADSLDLNHEFFEARIVAVENQLLSLPYQENYDATSLLQECCRIAALLFVHTTFWLWQKWNKVLEALVALLGRKLDLLQMMDCWQTPQLEALMWILFLGRYASNARNTADWFSRRLVTVTNNLGIASWEEARTVLLKFFYWDVVHSQAFSDAWDEVQLLRGWSMISSTLYSSFE